MADSIYSLTGVQRISSVCKQHTDNRASLTIVQDNYAPERSYSASIAATGGNTTVVAAITGRSIVVDSYVVGATGSSTFRFLSGTGTYLTGTMGLSANGSVSVSAGAGLTTVSGQALIINTSAAVGGSITYRIV
jgi:hypothetical protein